VGQARSLTTWPVYEPGEIILRPGVPALELAQEFARLLRKSTPDTDRPPDVMTIWRAFVALARLPVADVAEPGTDDDTVNLSAGTVQGEDGPQLVLSRYVVRRDGTDVDLWVIADLEGLEISERVSALAVAGSDAAAKAFADTVEANPAFPLLVAATVSEFEYGVDEID
jgi:hypothetical protein